MLRAAAAGCKGRGAVAEPFRPAVLDDETAQLFAPVLQTLISVSATILVAVAIGLGCWLVAVTRAFGIAAVATLMFTAAVIAGAGLGPRSTRSIAGLTVSFFLSIACYGSAGITVRRTPAFVFTVAAWLARDGIPARFRGAVMWRRWGVRSADFTGGLVWRRRGRGAFLCGGKPGEGGHAGQHGQGAIGWFHDV